LMAKHVVTDGHETSSIGLYVSADAPFIATDQLARPAVGSDEKKRSPLSSEAKHRDPAKHQIPVSSCDEMVLAVGVSVDVAGFHTITSPASYVEPGQLFPSNPTPTAHIPTHCVPDAHDSCVIGPAAPPPVQADLGPAGS
jgi:hypothetical protein